MSNKAMKAAGASPSGRSYRSTMTSLVYGSSRPNSAIFAAPTSLAFQKAQQTYYQAVRKMVQDGTVDRERINELRKAVADEFSSAAKVVGKETMQRPLLVSMSTFPTWLTV